jgi:Domain of unknown function (DUF4386)
MQAQWKARAAGFFWLMTIIAGIFSMVSWEQLIVRGNAAATIANIEANPSLFRLGSTADLLGVLCYIAVTLFIYELLAPVNRSLSLLAAFFSLTGCAVGAVGCALQIAPLVIVSDAKKYLIVFDPEQLQALAYLFLRWRGQVNSLGLVFFGLHCLLIGVLILKSAFLPRFVGALMLIAGLGWLTFLFPPLVESVAVYFMAPGIVGEATLTFWLLLKGVNVERWKGQAAAAYA